MLRILMGAAIACGLALTSTAAAARPHQARQHQAAAELVYCATDASYRATCSQPAARAVRGARRGRPLDANGNRMVRHEAVQAAARGYCEVDTEAGPIVIACGLGARMKGFIGEAVARGFKGRVKCFSLSKSHVAHSLHFIGEACDFAQRGWNRTVAPMYRVGDLAAKWGLRDGCTFGDCGHIDSGRGVARMPWPSRMAQLKGHARRLALGRPRS